MGRGKDWCGPEACSFTARGSGERTVNDILLTSNTIGSHWNGSISIPMWLGVPHTALEPLKCERGEGESALRRLSMHVPKGLHDSQDKPRTTMVVGEYKGNKMGDVRGPGTVSIVSVQANRGEQRYRRGGHY